MRDQFRGNPPARGTGREPAPAPVEIQRRRPAFTLIELLVVVAVIALLAAILLPSLSAAREAGRLGVCGSNIRQLAFANLGYATEHKDYHVPAAPDEFVGFGGTRRWHGVREASAVSEDPALNWFNPAKGPLVKYLAADGNVKRCPSFRGFREDGASNAFESGTGGYGYNNIYIGGRHDLYAGSARAYETPAKTAEVRRPAVTAVFTDAAFAQRQLGGGLFLVEYSFCTPPYLQLEPGPPSSFRAAPSLHFRHRGRISVAWADGHVEPRRLDFSGPSMAAGIRLEQMQALQLGWFGSDSNNSFDLN